MKKIFMFCLFFILSYSLSASAESGSIGVPSVKIAGNTANISLPVDAALSDDVILIAAFYSGGEQEIISVEMQKRMAQSAIGGPITLSASIPADASKLKVMVWDNKNTPYVPYVEVAPIVTTGIDLSSTENTFLKPGETSQLMINGAQAPASGVSYSVDNMDVVTVSDSGLVTAAGTGVATVTAQSGDKAASIMFVVTDADVHENGYETDGQSAEYARTGIYSHSLNANETILDNLNTKIKDNGVIQLWFYDDMKGYRPVDNYSPEDIFRLYGYNGGTDTINMWIYFSESLYRVQNAGKTAITSNNITRTVGWHQLLIYSTANYAYIYIDGSLLASTPKADGGLNELIWHEGNHLNMWIDDVTYADVMIKLPTSIDLSRTVNTFLKPGDYSQILVNGTANVPGVSYASSNEAVAAVDEAGMVTGISEGTAVITASAGSVTKKIMFAVTNNQINSKNYETDGNNTVQARTGEKSWYIAKDGGAAVKKDFAYPSISNGVVQLWFYDELNGGREAGTYDTYFNLYRWAASGDLTNFATCLAFTYDNRYGYQGTLDSSVTNYNNYRSKGWHQYMAYRYDTYVDIYVDGELMCRHNGIAKDAATTAIQWVGGDVNMWVDDIAFTSFTNIAQ